MASGRAPGIPCAVPTPSLLISCLTDAEQAETRSGEAPAVWMTRWWGTSHSPRQTVI